MHINHIHGTTHSSCAGCPDFLQVRYDNAMKSSRNHACLIPEANFWPGGNYLATGANPVTVHVHTRVQCITSILPVIPSPLVTVANTSSCTRLPARIIHFEQIFRRFNSVWESSIYNCFSNNMTAHLKPFTRFLLQELKQAAGSTRQKV